MNHQPPFPLAWVLCLTLTQLRRCSARQLQVTATATNAAFDRWLGCKTDANLIQNYAVCMLLKYVTASAYYDHNMYSVVE